MVVTHILKKTLVHSIVGWGSGLVTGVVANSDSENEHCDPEGDEVQWVLPPR